jgi:hypothetical protein
VTVRELSAAEHLEAALAMLGFDEGHWTVTVDAAGGSVRRAVGEQRTAKVGLSRDQLERPVRRPPAVGEPAA